MTTPTLSSAGNEERGGGKEPDGNSSSAVGRDLRVEVFFFKDFFLGTALRFKTFFLADFFLEDFFFLVFFRGRAGFLFAATFFLALGRFFPDTFLRVVFFWNTGFPPAMWLRDRVFKRLDRNDRLRYKVLSLISGQYQSGFSLTDRWIAAGIYPFIYNR